MKFRYIGQEFCEWFGFKWITGIEHDVTDPHAIGKLANSVLFSAVDGASAAVAEAHETAGPNVTPMKKPRKAKA